MRVQFVLCLIRPATDSRLQIKIYEPLTSQQVDALVAEQYKGWELLEIVE